MAESSTPEWSRWHDDRKRRFREALAAEVGLPPDDYPVSTVGFVFDRDLPEMRDLDDARRYWRDHKDRVLNTLRRFPSDWVPPTERRRAVSDELRVVADRLPPPPSAGDDFSSGFRHGIEAVREHLLRHAGAASSRTPHSLGLPDLHDHVPAARRPVREDDPPQPGEQERHALLAEHLARYFPDMDPDRAGEIATRLLALLPPRHEAIRLRRALNPLEDDIVDLLHELTQRWGFDVVELYRYEYVSRVLAAEAAALTPMRAGFGRTFEGGYDAVHTHVAGLLRTRAEALRVPEFPASLFRTDPNSSSTVLSVIA